MTIVFDTPVARKSRGAFFTPPELAAFMVDWAIREPSDSVLEPSCGDAVFLREAARRLTTMTMPQKSQLVGYDIHGDSLDAAEELLRSAGYEAELLKGDFFAATAARKFTAVVGNPPFIRFQGFNGQSRDLAIAHSREMGVELSGLASSWAGFVVKSADMLQRGGRLALVLPSELLSVNYAAPIRRFLLQRFSSVRIVVFDELIFAGVQADVVVVLAEDYEGGHTDHFTLHATKNAQTATTESGLAWYPRELSDKWTGALSGVRSGGRIEEAIVESFEGLSSWGAVSSGIVTGANDFFALSASQAATLGIADDELRRILPRGYSVTHLDSLSGGTWKAEAASRPGLLFSPAERPSAAAKRYIKFGEGREFHNRYKTRIRSDWWRVPMSTVPDFFVSYMSASTPRIVRNAARALNLNSTHGLRLNRDIDARARIALPIVALNSVTLMSSELVGRSYGGGILKMEPREAGRWLVPTHTLTTHISHFHVESLKAARRMLLAKDLISATVLVDQVIKKSSQELELSPPPMDESADLRLELLARRLSRGNSKGSSR